MPLLGRITSKFPSDCQFLGFLLGFSQTITAITMPLGRITSKFPSDCQFLVILAHFQFCKLQRKY